jgi:hypothetical protein
VLRGSCERPEEQLVVDRHGEPRVLDAVRGSRRRMPKLWRSKPTSLKLDAIFCTASSPFTASPQPMIGSPCVPTRK